MLDRRRAGENEPAAAGMELLEDLRDALKIVLDERYELDDGSGADLGAKAGHGVGHGTCFAGRARQNDLAIELSGLRRRHGSPGSDGAGEEVSVARRAGEAE